MNASLLKDLQDRFANILAKNPRLAELYKQLEKERKETRKSEVLSNVKSR